MASSTARGINFVRYFFYAKHIIPEVEKQSLVALAYATARDLEVAPKAILIRSRLHNTTSINGQHMLDPQGWHVTLAFKEQGQMDEYFHVASHGYTLGKTAYTMVLATHTPPKPDDTPRGGLKSGKVVWPDDVIEYTGSPIAYSHIPEKEK